MRSSRFLASDKEKNTERLQNINKGPYAAELTSKVAEEAFQGWHAVKSANEIAVSLLHEDEENFIWEYEI